MPPPFPTATAAASTTSHLALLLLLSSSSVFFLYKSLRLRRNNPPSPPPGQGPAPTPTLLYASATGTSKALAAGLSRRLAEAGVTAHPADAAAFDPDDLPSLPLLLLVLPTHDGGAPPSAAAFLARWLEESAADFRAGAALLSGLRFAVFGVGSRAYGETFNAAARSFSRWLRALGAAEVVAVGEGDVDGGDLEVVFEEWCGRVVRVVKGEEIGEGTTERAMALMSWKRRNPMMTTTKRRSMAGRSTWRTLPGRHRRQGGGMGRWRGLCPTEGRMGYKIIGSHSGVKICRWTKSQLRGRGGCYKHSFYGIESHRCMEATPSLACANKCVFCWRHHTNPVGKSWKWKMDDPLDIVNAAIDQHTKMVKQMKGVPGVKPERLAEGLSPRHCALSLVGEPIMYPEINVLIDELHRRHISTFLVTNAQFPDKIKTLKPITQLYVSVDAATKESLKAVDRPLFSDFWERFLDSLKSLHDKDQRTVYRLTLVKGWNAEEIDGYAKLLSLGQPDFIEIKGVTYCGSSATSKLTMENVPWHSDVKDFSEALALKSGGVYEVACEHAHSCCVLLAKVDKFKINGKWHTWIDYDRFHELVTSGKPFRSQDYMALTPSWAVYGAEEGGFDPDQSRYKKERRHGAAALKD
ncbi:hypothetical protein OsJ_12772 [Oryza sativa Japonica Group]|uniref:tRNA 4-demethylwyosine synthase (AdoMet-dependent) n=1 Tax=Oryza sativa subsp. japonica TaxID=39947 RepID=A3AN61_ORYSJ|nr:hypothetical protein OsJ_12772 [Oryza sativa Japonica Group]